MKNYLMKFKNVLTLLLTFVMMVSVLTVVPKTKIIAAPTQYVKSLKVSNSKLTLTAGGKKTVSVTVEANGSVSKKVKANISKTDRKMVSVKVSKPSKQGVTKLTIMAKKITKKKIVKVKILTLAKNQKNEMLTKTIKVTINPKTSNTEQATTEQLTTVETTTAESTTERSTTEILTTEKPTTEKPTTEKPTTEKPTTEKPITEKPTTENTTTEITTTEKPTTTEEINDKLVVWTMSNELDKFGQKYQEAKGVTVETRKLTPSDFPQIVEKILKNEECESDIVAVEPEYLQLVYEKGLLTDLNQFDAQDYADQIVDYVWKVGQDADGVQRAISYQITPAGIYYRRDIAQEVFGTEDPAEIGKLFADYPTILETAKVLKDKGYRIFASDDEISYFSGDSAWVVDGKLNVDQRRIDYMDLCIELYQQDLTAYVARWSTPWYIAMAGEVPILTADTQWGTADLNVWDWNEFKEATVGYETTQVFAYGFPAWGVLTMKKI